MAIEATYVSSTVFTVEQDQTTLFTTDRLARLDCGVDGYKYGTIVSSVYTTLTTVTISESVITSNLESVVVGLVQSGSSGSLPVHSHNSNFGQGGDLSDSYVPSGGPYYGNTRIVAKSGGQYTSIQAAIDSVTDAAADNKYTIQVYPGTYTENIVMKDYVNVIGLCERRGTKIYSTSGTLITMSAIESHLDWIDLEMSATSSNDILLDATAGGGSTGFHRIENGDIRITSSVEGINPIGIKANVGIGIYFINVTFTYIMSGTSAISGDHTPIVLESTNKLMYYLRSIARATVSSSNGNVFTISDNSEGRILAEIVTLQVTSLNALNTGIFAPVGVFGTESYVKQYNTGVYDGFGAGAGTGYAIYYDTATDDGTANSSRNLFNISGFGTNKRYYVGTGDTLLSYFNRHITDLTDDIIGSIKIVDVYNNDDFIISENIGAGTETPEAQLHIKGGAAGVILEHDSGVQWAIRSLSQGYFSFKDRDANKDRLIFDSNGNANFGESNPNDSAILGAESTTKGFLPPVMTGAQVEAISSPTEGLIAYATSAGSGDVTAKGPYYWNGTNWIAM